MTHTIPNMPVPMPPNYIRFTLFQLNAPEPQIVFLGVVFLVSFLRVLVLFCPTLFEHTHQQLFKLNKRNDGGGNMEWGVWGLLRGHQKQYSLLFFLLLVCSKMPMGIIPILQGFFSESQGLNLGFGYWGSILLVGLCCWLVVIVFFSFFLLSCLN